MKAQIMPKGIKVGSSLYYASSYTDEDTGKSEIDVQQWVVRSVKRKRGSQTRSGRAYLVEHRDRDDNSYVNITRKEPYVTTDHKSGKWMKSIPSWCRKQFLANSSCLPDGFYTTKGAALRSLLAGLKDELRLAKIPKESRSSWMVVDSVEVIEKEIRLVKARITKIKNKKEKEGVKK